MTFFLPQTDEAPVIPSQNPKVDLPDWGDGFSAHKTMTALENDANFVAARRRIGVRDGMARDVINRLGMDAFRPIVEERNAKAREQGMPSKVIDMPETTEQAVELLGPNFSTKAIDLARKAAAENPEAWADMDLSDEAIEARTNEVLQAEYEDAQQIAAMSPVGSVGQMAASMTGATLDVKILPSMLLGGGGGSIARIAVQEAMINMAVEAAFLPAQFDMADRLEIAEPNVLQHLAMAGVAGGVLGGGVAAVGRGWLYYRQRNETPAFRGMDDIQARMMVDEVEDILTSDTSQPFEQIARVTERAATEATKRPYLAENPINPEKPPLVPEVKTTTLPPAETGKIPDTAMEPPVEDGFVRMYHGGELKGDAALNNNFTTNRKQAESYQNGGSLYYVDVPKDADVVEYLANNDFKVDLSTRLDPDDFGGATEIAEVAGDAIKAAKPVKPKGRRPTTLKTFIINEGGIFRGDDGGELAQIEYRRPGFLKKNKYQASAAGNNGGGLTIDEMRVRAEEQGFIPAGSTRNDFLEAIKNDVRGTRRIYSDRDAMEAELWRAFDGEKAQDPDAATPAVTLQKPIEGGLFINRDAFLVDTPEEEALMQIDASVRKWITENGFDDILSEVEKREISDQLQRSGGESQYLIQLMAERELAAARAPDAEPEDIPFGDVGARSGDATGRPGLVTQEAGSGNQGQGARRAEPTQSESTSAGDQTLIDGVAPITARDRLQAQQEAPLRGGNAAADDGLFDMGARDQADMFSDPTSPEAREIQDIVTNDLRAEVEAAGDFPVDVPMPDGSTRSMTVSQALDYLDEGDAFSARIDLCGMGPST